MNPIIVKIRQKSDFALADQLRRTSVSISSNIAEGFERNNNKDFRRFLYYSKGSAGGVRSQLYLSVRLDYIMQNEYEGMYVDLITISGQLKGFINYLAKWYEENKT